jgi:hypothetical protein
MNVHGVGPAGVGAKTEGVVEARPPWPHHAYVHGDRCAEIARGGRATDAWWAAAGDSSVLGTRAANVVLRHASHVCSCLHGCRSFWGQCADKKGRASHACLHSTVPSTSFLKAIRSRFLAWPRARLGHAGTVLGTQVVSLSRSLLMIHHSMGAIVYWYLNPHLTSAEHLLYIYTHDHREWQPQEWSTTATQDLQFVATGNQEYQVRANC